MDANVIGGIADFAGYGRRFPVCRAGRGRGRGFICIHGLILSALFAL